MSAGALDTTIALGRAYFRAIDGLDRLAHIYATLGDTETAREFQNMRDDLKERVNRL